MWVNQLIEFMPIFVQYHIIVLCRLDYFYALSLYVFVLIHFQYSLNWCFMLSKVWILYKWSSKMRRNWAYFGNSIKYNEIFDNLENNFPTRFHMSYLLQNMPNNMGFHFYYVLAAHFYAQTCCNRLSVSYLNICFHT